jgi:hypothetical protein
MRWAAAVPALVALVAACGAACGETRLPIGDECLRGEDCLSGVCSSRTCVAAPALVTGVGGPPPAETARIPLGDAGADAPADAPSEGG